MNFLVPADSKRVGQAFKTLEELKAMVVQTEIEASAQSFTVKVTGKHNIPVSLTTLCPI